MRTVSLGEFTATVVGFGDLSLSRATVRNIDVRDVERTLHEGLSLGISLVDVADEDGARAMIGEALRTLRMRDRVVAGFRLPPRGLLASRVEAILRTTKLDALPLVQLELAPANRRTTWWPDFVGTCQRLVKAGKVRAWGATVTLPPADELADAVEDFSWLAAEPWLVSMHANYSLCDRRADALLDAIRIARAAPPPVVEEAPPPPKPGSLVTSGSLLDVMTAALASPLAGLALSDPAFGLAPLAPTETAPVKPKPVPRTQILAARPLAGGTLAGVIAPGTKLSREDDRRAISDEQLAKIAVAMGQLSPLVRTTPPAARATDAARAITDRVKKRDDADAFTMAELALRFAIDRGAIVLPRLHRRDHLIDAIAAASAGPLPPTVVARLDEFPWH